jgi:hypothetical protein
MMISPPDPSNVMQAERRVFIEPWMGIGPQIFSYLHKLICADC